MRVPLAVAVVCLTAAAACSSPGTAARALEPDAPTAGSALGEKQTLGYESGEERGTCLEPDGGGSTTQPLVVDWPSEGRVDLGIGMNAGIVVVRVRCGRVALLGRCSTAGNYRFAAGELARSTIHLEGADEIRANLPLAAARLGAETRSRAAIDVGVAYVGRRTAVVGNVTRTELRGDCNDATHFVRSAWIGAFRVRKGTSGHAATFAEIAGTAGASATTASASTILHQEGTLENCDAHAGTTGEAPERCRSPIRLELAAIGATAPEPAAPELGAICGAGLVWSEGKCAKPAMVTSYRCERSDLTGCLEQCDRGNADSCYNAAYATLGTAWDGKKARTQADVSKRYESAWEKAVLLYQRACEGGVGAGCRFASEYPRRDEASRLKLLERGCSLLDDISCAGAARAARKADPQHGFDLALRGCDMAGDQACGVAADMLIEGQGIPADVPRGLGLLMPICRTGYAWVCAKLARIHREGKFVPPSPATADDWDRMACRLNHHWCRRI